MIKIFLATHGHLASGFKSSLDILLGDSSNVTIFDAYVDEHSVQSKLDDFYRNVDEKDQVFLLSDLYGGSVNQAMFTYLKDRNTTLITGVNLALILELAMKLEPLDERAMYQLVENSRKVLLIVKEDQTQFCDDFF